MFKADVAVAVSEVIASSSLLLPSVQGSQQGRGERVQVPPQHQLKVGWVALMGHYCPTAGRMYVHA